MSRIWTHDVTMSPARIHHFWFGGVADWSTVYQRHHKMWFRGGEQVDRRIRERFLSTIHAANAGLLDHWVAQPRGALSLVLVLDQFPRNVFRRSPLAFACDTRARRVLDRCLQRGDDAALSPIERSFLYLPYEHAEDLALQDRCVRLFEQLLEQTPATLRDPLRGSLDYARRHRDIIARFGRFPHRNAVLGRVSSVEELAWLDDGAERFGQ